MLNTIKAVYATVAIFLLDLFQTVDDYVEEDHTVSTDTESGRKIIGRKSPNIKLDDMGLLIRYFRDTANFKRSLDLGRAVDLSSVAEGNVRKFLVEHSKKLLLTVSCNLNIAAVERMEKEGIFVSLVERGHRRTKVLMLSNGNETFSVHILVPNEGNMYSALKAVQG